MAAHGFVAYLLEIYLVVAAELGALDVVKAFFAAFARGDGDVFDLHNGYGICNILLMLDDESRDVREPRFGDGRCTMSRSSGCSLRRRQWIHKRYIRIRI